MEQPCDAGATCDGNPGAPCTLGTQQCGAAPACVDGAHASAGTACGSGLICDGLGACVDCAQGMACTTNPTACHAGSIACASGAATCVDGAPLPMGAACGTSQKCDGAGNCLAPACDDGLKNGTETDVDCGGPCTTKCADTKGCAVPGDCASGVCTANVCQAPTCSDGVKNGDEPAADCGHSCPTKCADMKACATADDCASAVCTSQLCQAATCTDGVKNGAESDKDCGGPSCAACADGKKCGLDADCQSAVCGSTMTCSVPSCTDGVKNGNEPDVDCGGSCPMKCADLERCGAAGDCVSGVCQSQLCVSASCLDSVLNGTETDKDCGGNHCGPCADGKVCKASGDCQSAVCNLTSMTCSVPSCSDGVKNGDEPDTDCGHSCPNKCNDLQACAVLADCSSGVCSNQLCQVPTCSDGVTNGVETDRDCGGMACAPCADFLHCRAGVDCRNGVCTSMTCSAAACNDNVKNGSEADVDCGQACPTKCANQKACMVAADCASSVCSSQVCQAASCLDGTVNGTETDKDCGGSACAPCADGKACLAGADCQNGVCTSMTCSAATCSDGVKNGGESAVDCGHVCPTRCADLQGCAVATDCASAVCSNQLCQVPTCVDATVNGTETDQDCGGMSCPPCVDSKGCLVGADCQNGVCGPSMTCSAASCTDGVKNGGETATDCGHSCPVQCADGQGCAIAADCMSAVCSGQLCQTATCADNTVNGTETDKDCGGMSCPPCANGKQCKAGSDCQSQVCGVTMTCNPVSCSDGVKNGNEQGIDCGGSCPLMCDPSVYATPIDPTIPTDIMDAWAFLYTGPNAIQKSVTAPFDARRFAIIRGRVLDASMNGLGGITVRVAGHPEWGFTQTRADGMYDFCVDGGGQLLLTFTAPDRLPAERRVDVPWRDFAWVPDVALLQLDPNVTMVDFSAPTLARGSVITDKDGTRQAAVFFPPGTTATLRFFDGGTKPLPTATVHITEYTVGDAGEAAMPGLLPASSAYTYASEYTVEEAVDAGAWRVEFSQNVIGYVDNFIGIPVGTVVPNGYYDKRLSTWVPEPSGRVIRVLSTDSGFAMLDLDGGGQPVPVATLQDAGITDAERAQLAATYAPGTQLWRVPMGHFSDWNWPYGFPMGAEPPNRPPPVVKGGDSKPCMQPGCTLELQNQTLGEDIPIQGTPYALHYSSDRVVGRASSRHLDIALTGPTLPPGLLVVAVAVTVLGQRTYAEFFPAANLHYQYEWNGLDAAGRAVQGPQTATVQIGFGYSAVYGANDALAFGGFGTIGVGKGARHTIFSWQTMQAQLGSMGGMDYRGLGLGGWSLSPHHTYSSLGRTLYKGSGGRLDRNAFGRIITNIAYLPVTSDIIVTADKSVYVSGGGDLYKMGPDGSNVQHLYPPAYVVGDRMGLAPDGTFYTVIRDSMGNDGLYRASPDALTHTLVTQIPFGNGDKGISVAKDGTIYVGMRPGCCSAFGGDILRIAPDGKWSTIFSSTDQNHTLRDVAVNSKGEVYFGGGRGIAKLAPDGTWTHVAGTSAFNVYAGDDVPASGASLYNSLSFAFDREDNLFLADTVAVREITPDGIITTIAGDGIYDGYRPVGPDNIPARDSYFYNIGATAIAVAPDGDLYISQGNFVSRITSAMPGYSTNSYVVPSDDGREAYVFDKHGRHLQTVDAMNGVVLRSFGYDSAGRVITVTDQDGNVTTVQRDASGVPTAIVAPGGQVTTLAIGANGYLASATDPAGRTTSLSYTPGGLLTSKSFGGATHRFTYNALGELLSAQDPDGVLKTLTNATVFATTTWTFSIDGGTTSDVQMVQAPHAPTIRVAHDGAGGTITSTEPRSSTTTAVLDDGTTLTTNQGRDPRWNMLAPIDGQIVTTLPDSGTTLATVRTRTATVAVPNNPLSLTKLTETVTTAGLSWVTAWNADAGTATQTSPAGHVATLTFNTRGHLTRIQADTAISSPVTLSYTPQGRLQSIQHGTMSTTLAYDAKRRLIGVVDATGAMSTTEYDLADHVTAVVTPGMARYQFGYDARDNRTSVTMPNTSVHQFTYDLKDRVTGYTAPGGTPHTWAYSADGLLTTSALASGKVVGYQYDAANKVTRVSYPEAAVDIAYAGTSDHRASVTRTPTGGGMPQGAIMTWDGQRLTSYGQLGSSNGTYRFSYDSAGRVSGLSLDLGPTSARTRDADGNVTGYGPFTLTRGVATTISTISVGATQVGAFTYDGLARETVKAVSATSESYRYALSYDNAGRLAHKVERLDGATVHTFDYAYDAEGRLMSVARDTVLAEQYSYDSNGNRIGRTLGMGPAELATFDPQDRMLSRGGVGYQYDAEGFLTARGGDTFAYSALGELLSATVGGSTVTYGYDGDGRRVSRTDAAGTYQYLYADEYTARVTHTRSPAGVVTEYFYDDEGRLFGLRRAGTTYLVATDQVGTPRRVIDLTGTVLLDVEYDAWGNVVSGDPSAFDLPIGFAGGLADSLTGLLRFGHRDYDPAAGRWTARDPSLFAGGLNLYAYAGSDPLSVVDRDGLGPDPLEEKANLLLQMIVQVNPDLRPPDGWTLRIENPGYFDTKGDWHEPAGYTDLTSGKQQIWINPADLGNYDIPYLADTIAHELIHVREGKATGIPFNTYQKYTHKRIERWANYYAKRTLAACFPGVYGP